MDGILPCQLFGMNLLSSSFTKVLLPLIVHNILFIILGIVSSLYHLDSLFDFYLQNDGTNLPNCTRSDVRLNLTLQPSCLDFNKYIPTSLFPSSELYVLFSSKINKAMFVLFVCKMNDI